MCCGIDREGNDPGDSSQITYGELLKQVCKFANVLKAKGLSFFGIPPQWLLQQVMT